MLYLLSKDKQSALAQYKVIKFLDSELGQKLYQVIHQDKVLNLAKY
jgi:hypothetical protein